MFTLEWRSVANSTHGEEGLPDSKESNPRVWSALGLLFVLASSPAHINAPRCRAGGCLLQMQCLLTTQNK